MFKDQKLYKPENSINTIFDRALDYMNDKYIIRFNEISLEYEIRLIEKKKWHELNINSLFIELSQAGINIPINRLEILIKSHLIEKYNPIKEYFEMLPEWDGIDHIGNLVSYIKTSTDEAFLYHLEKWFTRTVLCALEKGKVNKQCFVLTSSKQNIGKSYFLNFFIPKQLENYYTENVSVDKDGNIALCKNLIINADELAVFSKTDVNALKAFISKSSVNIRLPYGRKAERMERICSFVGSTNKTEFLTDTTGNVRWLVFEVLDIDFNYSKDIDINKVWTQAYYNAYKRPNYNPELSSLDVEENEVRNKRFMQLTEEQEIIIKYFEKSDNKEDFMNASDVKKEIRNELGITLNHINIGRALSSLNFKKVKHSKKQLNGYLIKSNFNQKQ